MTLPEDVNTKELQNEIIASYLEEFQDNESRHLYVNEFLNAKIATQIKVLREQRGWTQEELAEKTQMKQERISVLEDVNYESWTLSVLRRFAKAFDLRLNVEFEDFASFIQEFKEFGREALERVSFENDLAFNSAKNIPSNVVAFNPSDKAGTVVATIAKQRPSTAQGKLWLEDVSIGTKKKEQSEQISGAVFSSGSIEDLMNTKKTA